MRKLGILHKINFGKYTLEEKNTGKNTLEKHFGKIHFGKMQFGKILFGKILFS